MRALLNLVLPPLCPVCRTLVPHKNTVCPSCWKNLNFISAPFCCQCSLPFETTQLSSEEDLSFQKCGTCLQIPPSFSQARSAYVYDDLSKKMILSFKHGDLSLAPFFAQSLALAAKDLVATTDLIVPVPLHWQRLYQRGFNQSAVLACHLKKIIKQPIALNLLKRIRATPSQGNFSVGERIKNVEGCFKVSNPLKIKGKSILLIDDVMTTGATLNACAKALLKAGALEVSILCIARVTSSK